MLRFFCFKTELYSYITYYIVSLGKFTLGCNIFSILFLYVIAMGDKFSHVNNLTFEVLANLIKNFCFCDLYLHHYFHPGAVSCYSFVPFPPLSPLSLCILNWQIFDELTEISSGEIITLFAFASAYCHENYQYSADKTCLGKKLLVFSVRVFYEKIFCNFLEMFSGIILDVSESNRISDWLSLCWKHRRTNRFLKIKR